jgi:hypothetical protein
MAENFDAYHVWLGIPPEDQPPNHYRLLGIRPFESNPDVIDNMADQRMTHLRTFQSGKNSKYSQKLLNEVAAARLCLLNSKTKQDYDRKLRAAAAASQSVSQASQPSSPATQPRVSSTATTPQPLPTAPASREQLRRTSAAAATAPPVPEAFEFEPSPFRGSAARRKSLNGPLVGAAIGLVAVIGLGIGYTVMKEHDQASSELADPAKSLPLVTPAKTPEPPKPNANTTSTLVFHSHVAPTEHGEFKLWVDDTLIPSAGGETWEFSCQPGQHRVKAIRPGFKPFETVATVAVGQRQSIDLEWHSATALRFKWPIAEREGAVLTIDGKVQSLDAAELEFPLEPGPHQVRIDRRGFRSQVKTVDMTAGGIPPLAPVWIAAAERPAIAQTLPTPKATPPRRDPDPATKAAPAPKLASNDGPDAKSFEKPATKETKVAVPDQAAQATATKTIQDIYRDDIKRAVTAAQKLELAKKLRTDGVGTADDPVGRFVLLKTARDLAAAGGDLDLAGEVIDDLADRYEVERLEMKSELLIASSKNPQHPDDCSARLNALADDAVAADRYDLARRALAAALALKDPSARKQIAMHQKEINETEAEFHRLKPTFDALKANPDDPAANLAIGKFDCLAKGNFEAGLPLLAKGSDKALADLATLDLAQSTDSAEQIKVADGWWDTGKRAARLRAKAIYEAALPSLNGISRVRIEKRLQEFEAKAGVEGWTNLLRLIDPEKNSVQGKWSRSSDGLQCELGGWGQRIAIPFEPAPSYDIRVEFTRLSGTNDVMLLLPVASHQVRVTLGVGGRVGGIDRINNQMVMVNSPLAHPAPIENNKRYVLDVGVRTSADGTAAEIFVRVNGAEFASFQGPVSQLTGLPYGWRLPDEKLPALGANSAIVTFHSVQYRKVMPRAGGR